MSGDFADPGVYPVDTDALTPISREGLFEGATGKSDAHATQIWEEAGA